VPFGIADAGAGPGTVIESPFVASGAEDTCIEGGGVTFGGVIDEFCGVVEVVDDLLKIFSNREG